MPDSSLPDYSIFDRPEIVSMLFHPRPDLSLSGPLPGVLELLIPVAPDICLGAKLHTADRAGPVILFFHGNGEIVSDYDELGGIYTGMGINFLVVDYRGYGRSTGLPTVSGMMEDCHTVFAYVKKELKEIYNEFWEFIDEDNKLFQVFIRKDMRRKKLSS